MTKDEVKKALAGGFDLVSQKDMPFLIREHQRKYQIGYARLECVCVCARARACVYVSACVRSSTTSRQCVCYSCYEWIVQPFIGKGRRHLIEMIVFDSSLLSLLSHSRRDFPSRCSHCMVFKRKDNTATVMA